MLLFLTVIVCFHGLLLLQICSTEWLHYIPFDFVTAKTPTQRHTFEEDFKIFIASFSSRTIFASAVIDRREMGHQSLGASLSQMV